MADLGAWSQINCFENWSRIFKREIVKRVDVLLPWLLGNLEIVEITVVCKLLQPIMQRRRISSGQQTEMFLRRKRYSYSNLKISRSADAGAKPGFFEEGVCSP